MQRAPLLIAGAALVLATGCRHELGRLAVMSPAGPATAPPSGPRVEGEDCALWLMGVPVGAPSLDAATRAALAGHRGAHALRDVRVQSSFWSALAFGQECLIVTGTPAA